MSSAPRFAASFDVYWEDTDAGGVVYYANYLRFLERARTDWLRAMGVDQQQLRSEHKLQFVVVSISVDFLRPAVLRIDEILVTAELLTTGRCLTIQFKQTIMRGEDQLKSKPPSELPASIPARASRVPSPKICSRSGTQCQNDLSVLEPGAGSEAPSSRPVVALLLIRLGIGLLRQSSSARAR